MNDLQAKQIDLLKKFIDICKKNNLTWFCVCGTALGAEKYGGFIPWDDDIDVALPREDYEVFLKIAQAELPDYIFIQNYRTDKSFPHVFTKMRNSNTTLIEEGMAHLDMNHGIYIDIFPLDGYPKTAKGRERLRKKKKFLNWQIYSALKNNCNLRMKLRNSFFRFLGYHKRTSHSLKKLDGVISQYKIDESDIWCNHGNWQGELEYAHKAQYGKGKVVFFEGVEVIVPEQIDAYLTQKYGDWRSDPPLEKQKSHHYIKILDTTKSYKEYL